MADVEERTTEIPEVVMAWVNTLPELGIKLTPQQELACAFRLLARSGYSQNLAGHITVAADESNELFWVNPWGRWWEEVQASDICLVDLEGKVVAGRWDVTPAIFIHTEIHRRRPEARVVVHNHPYYGTLLATIGELPGIGEQTGCMFDGEMGLFEEFTGGVDNASAGEELARALSDASVALLVNHGVLVTGSSVAEATYRAISFERVCQLHVDAARLGKKVRPMNPDVRQAMKLGFMASGPRAYWPGAVRMLIKAEPDVLD